MADPAVLATAIGTAVSGGLIGIAKLIDAIAYLMEVRRKDGGKGSGKRRRELRKARQLEKRARELRERANDGDDGDDNSVVPFELRWAT